MADADALSCLVTGGLPVKMSAASFANLCAAKREAVGTEFYLRRFLKFRRRCDRCQGDPANWPPELEIVAQSDMTAQTRHSGSGRSHDPDRLHGPHCQDASLRPSARSGAQQETPDGKPGNCGPIFQADNQITETEKKNMANCNVCGKPLKAINRSHGLELCSSCKGIMPGVTKHLPELVTMMKAVGKTAEVAEMLGLSAAASPCSEDARHDLEAVVQDARETLVKALPPVPETLDDTQSLFDIATLAVAAARHIAALTKERDQLAKLVDEASGEAEPSTAHERLDVWQTGSAADPLDEALLRWAKRQHQAGRVRVQMEVVEVEP